ncbi:MAG: STAS/SEC14 domain-containing protein [Microscillaceae bacterium]|jgi:hypothetical protein|nr:STAS/SEC14 domain-containing protein [Microscillaceae bacterium]
MLVYESDYISIFYHADTAIVEGVWHESTKKLRDDDFKTDMLAWLKAVQTHQPVNVLANTREYYHSISPELQQWVNEHILAHYLAAGVKKLGFIVTSDLFAQVSIEQTIEEQAQSFSALYFEDEDKAIAWLRKA